MAEVGAERGPIDPRDEVEVVAGLGRCVGVMSLAPRGAELAVGVASNQDLPPQAVRQTVRTRLASESTGASSESVGVETVRLVEPLLALVDPATPSGPALSP